MFLDLELFNNENIYSKFTYNNQTNYLLGVGHLQRIRTPDRNHKGDVDRFIRTKGTRAYFQFFYLLRNAPPFDVIGVSNEVLFNSNSKFGTIGESLCESIQFASGLHLNLVKQEIILTYGINDCESRLLKMGLWDILEMVRETESEDITFEED